MKKTTKEKVEQAKKEWRRLRDLANKEEAVRDQLVEIAILGGIAPRIRDNMD